MRERKRDARKPAVRQPGQEAAGVGASPTKAPAGTAPETVTYEEAMRRKKAWELKRPILTEKGWVTP